MRKIIMIVISISMGLILFGDLVNMETAERIALSWKDLHNEYEKMIDYSFTEIEENIACYYIFAYKPAGFVIISADDNVFPILGYSFDSKIKREIDKPALKSLLKRYKNEITDVILNARENKDSQEIWNKLHRSDFSDFTRDRNVDPLLATTWDQDYPWNTDCPSDNQGPGGYVYVGCVAVSMAQIINYWEYPTTDTGSHSYTHEDYGLLEADFGNYNFNNMQNTYATGATRELLFHCGVAVNMDYGPDGSGSNSSYAEYAMKYHFDFDLGLSLEYKNSYSQSQWEELLRSELDNGRPMYYAGEDTQFGHAFNLDGYQGTNHFHFNWGWSPDWYNGYYYLSNLNPGGYNFNTNQQAIIGIQPPEIPLPPNNLSASIMGNDVLLIWETPALERELTGFNVYRNEEEIYYAEGSSNTSYFDFALEDGDYTYYVTSVYDQIESEPSEEVQVHLGTAVNEELVSDNIFLDQNFPNPFSSKTTISFSLTAKDAQNAKLEIYNIKGQTVKKIPAFENSSTQLGAGSVEGSITWNGTDKNNNRVPAGIYFYKLKGGRYTSTKKMILMK